MLYTISEREFVGIIADKSDSVLARSRYTAPVMAAVTGYWISRLDPGASLVLLWLVGRTLSHGKAADQISHREFTTDTVQEEDGIASAGLPMTKVTVRKHLASLCEHGLIHVYVTKSINRDAETKPRIFEIDCKKVVEGANLPVHERELFVQIGREIAASTGLPRGGQKLSPGGQNLSPQSCIYRESSSGIGKPILYAPRSAAVDEALEEEDEMKPLATPKIQRPTKVRENLTVAETLARVTATSRVKEGGRAAQAAGGQITVANVQALIDKAMREHLPELPRVVITQKPFGVFRKRLDGSNVDLAKFLSFTLSQWSTLSSQNRAAMLKDPTRARRSSPLPQAPDFTTLAYKLPYFLKVFANNITVAKETEKTSGEDRERDALRAKLEKSERELALAKGLLRDRPRPILMRSRPALTVRPVVQSAAVTRSDDVLSDSWSPPEWSEGDQQNTNTRRAVRGK